MKVDVTPPAIITAPGRTVSFSVTVHNNSNVINAYRVAMLGVDPAWVTTDHDALSLFPDQTRSLNVTLSVPKDHPAGRRELAIQVTSLNDPNDFALTQVALEVQPVVAIAYDVEPSSSTGGRRTVYSVVIANTGNTSVELVPTLVDDEELCRATFEPPTVSLEPTEQQIVEAEVTGKRPWFATPAVRMLHFGADGIEPPPDRVATFIQRPRIGRWLLSLLGLMAAAAVFATVLSRAFGDVIDEAQIDPDIIDAALADDEADGGGAGSSTDPDVAQAPQVSGSVLIRGTDTGISGATVELFAADNGLIPVANAATNGDGAFSIPGLRDGTYRLRVQAAGFGERWFERATSFEAATDIEVAEGASPSITIELGGEPGAITGSIVAEDPSGAVVTLEVQGELTDSTVDAQVTTVEVTATGDFEFLDVPAPATYELTVTKPGFAIQRQIINLAGGERRDRVEVVLLPGDGQIAGQVTGDGGPLGGVTVTATDGTNAFQTVTLTTDADLGTYVVRELPTPATYTVTFERDGYLPASQTLTLVEGGTQEGVNIVLSRAVASIAGTVSAAPPTGGTAVPTGGVTVTATNGADTFLAVSVSQPSDGAPVGSFVFADVPAPDVYTLTFSLDGYTSQTRSVNVAGPTNGVDATLVPSVAILRGTVNGATSPPEVFPVESSPAPRVTVTLSDGTNDFATVTADEPTGAYELRSVPPGSYTVTFDRPGSQPLTQIVTLTAGEVEVLDVVIGRQALIRGVVTSDGQPANGASVRLYRVEDFPDGDPLATVVTGSDGAYEFDALDAPETYVVTFAPSPSAGASDSANVSLDPGEQAIAVDGSV